MKLFAIAFRAACSSGIGVALATEHDLRIEAIRCGVLPKRDFTAEELIDFVENATFGSKMETDDRDTICCNVNYEGKKYIWFGNHADEYNDRIITNGHF